MKINEIMKLEDQKKLFDQLLVPARENLTDEANIDKWKNEFSGNHNILRKPNKIIYKTKDTPTDEYEQDYLAQNNTDETEITIDPDKRDIAKIVQTAKNVYNFQAEIVKQAKMFLFGAPVRLIDDSEDINEEAFNLIRETWKYARCNSLNLRLAEDMMVYTEAAEYWFIDPETKKVKMTVFSRKNGYKLYPHFDDLGNLDAFTIEYSNKDENNKAILNRYVYTQEKIYIFTQKKADANEYDLKVKDNLINKIPIVYWSQPVPEWENVQGLIDRFENSSSYHSDTNDYNADPVLKIFGEVKNQLNKGDTGKILEFATEMTPDGKLDHGDAEFAVWDQSIDSMKYEQEVLRNNIYQLTHTIDLTLEKLKGLGNPSGVAIKLLFFNAILKAQMKWMENISEYMDRRISIMKTILSFLNEKLRKDIEDTEISLDLGSVLPENVKEIVDNLVSSRPGKMLISQETAVKHAPFNIPNSKKEIEKLQEEEGNDLLGGDTVSY